MSSFDLDNIHALEKKKDSGDELTQEERDTLMNYYRVKFSSFGSALQNKLKAEAAPLVEKRDQFQQNIAELQSEEDVQTLTDLRNDAKELRKKIKDQSAKDACKTFTETEKKVAEIEKKLRALQKKFKNAGGEGQLPGVPKSNRGGRRNKAVKPEEGASASDGESGSDHESGSDGEQDHEVNQYSDKPRQGTKKRERTDDSEGSVSLRFAGAE